MGSWLQAAHKRENGAKRRKKGDVQGRREQRSRKELQERNHYRKVLVSKHQRGERKTDGKGIDV